MTLLAYLLYATASLLVLASILASLQFSDTIRQRLVRFFGLIASVLFGANLIIFMAGAVNIFTPQLPTDTFVITFYLFLTITLLVAVLGIGKTIFNQCFWPKGAIILFLTLISLASIGVLHISFQTDWGDERIQL